MTKECIDLLYLKGRNINASVSGINGTILNIKKNAVTIIANASKSFNHTLQFFIIPEITRITPVMHLNILNLAQIQKKLI